ncbi:MAG: hypothetical protein HYY84_13745 [Deltaproteobacteria bacterium]|nr:hypothetical protein [Deltaproteobacteria bacterium]
MSVESKVEKAIRRLAALGDGTIRRHALAEIVATESPEVGCGLLARIVSDSLARRASGAALMITLAQLLAVGPFPYAVASEIYGVAKVAGFSLVTGLMVGCIVREPEDEPRTSLAHFTLGERRALARRPTPHAIEKLLVDPDPIVIRNLLNAPRLTEREVVKIAAARTTSARVLLEILKSRRFGNREHVRIAVARNPRTPFAVALSVLPSLDSRAIAEIARDPSANEALRVAARTIFSSS